MNITKSFSAICTSLIFFTVSLLLTGTSCDSGNLVNNNIPVIIPVTGVTVKPSTVIPVGKTEQLPIIIVPSTATNQEVTWTSASETIATVSSAGLITGIAEGTTVVRVTTLDANFTAQCEVTVIVNGTLTDIDGNVYKTVKIGNQEWMAENLRVTRYNEGTAISNITSGATWDSCQYTNTPAYRYYNDATDADTIRKWGALYNWYVVAPANPLKIAPVGWHVPDSTDWNTLENYLIANGYNWDGTITGNKIAKSMTLKAYWQPSNYEGAIGCDLPPANNKSGFSALPGGSCSGYSFMYLSYYGYWWSATECTNSSFAFTPHFKYESDNFYSNHYSDKTSGMSLRLVRD